jgi:hypothetical protein
MVSVWLVTTDFVIATFVIMKVRYRVRCGTPLPPMQFLARFF